MCPKAVIQLLVVNITFILVCMIAIVGAFNVNIMNARVFKDSTDKGNMFGYTTALYNSDDGGVDALVGAPEASTSAFDGGPRSGKVYLFKDILNPASTLQETIYNKALTPMVNGSHNEGFGSTIVARDSKNILICSPNWKDTENSTTNYYTFMLGRCVLQRPGNFTEFAPMYEPNPKRRYWKKIGTSLSFYLRGLATLGFSADMDEKFIAFGTPGIFNFEGSVYVHDLNKGTNYEMQIREENNLKTTAYGNLGYSLKLGRFCGISASFLCLVAGAPNLYNLGQVKILRKMATDRYITVVQEINGTEMWSNFGYSLGVIKTKQDQDVYDELLIGAPLYTEWNNENHIPDQGAVFTYKYDHDNKKFEKKDIVLHGSKQRYARFGAAISDIGDINLDGFSDFAIGAPGENNGAGCIYIYLGSASGFIATPSQRIPASEIERQLKGLGFAFSNNQVPKNRNYPVFATTSIVSETVAVLGCRYIVEVETELTAIPNPVNTKIPCSISKIQGSCFNVQLCLRHKIKGENFQQLKYSIHLEIDTKIKSSALKRALFRLESDQQAHTVNKSSVAVTNANTFNCSTFTAVLREAQINRDRFTPITIVAEYRIEPSQTPANDPVLDATKANNKTIEVTFVNECGSDAKCEVDLILTASVLHVPSDGLWTDVVVNYTKELNLKIEIKNKNDTAYGIVANIEIDSFVSFLKAKSEPNCEAKTAAINTTDTSSLPKDKTLITCNFFEPLDSNNEIKFNLLFDTDQDNVRKNDLQIKIDAFPRNKEHNQEISPDDNIKVINRKVYIISNITLESLSSPNEQTIYDAKNKPDNKPKGQVSGKEDNLLNVTHKILIRNQGPSYLPKTVVHVKIPIYIVESSQLVTKAEVKMFTLAGEVYCESVANTGELAGTTQSTDNDNDKDITSTLSTTTVDDGNDGPQSQRRRRSADNKCQGKTCFLRCKDNPNLCQVFACELNTILQPNGYAEINVTMTLDLSSMFIAEEFNTLKFATHVEVNPPKHSLFKPWVDLKHQETITTFHFIQSGGKINIWIIIGSIIAGLVLITIIVLILWKVGFFKRTKHLEVQKMKRESMRRSMKVTTKPKTEE